MRSRSVSATDTDPQKTDTGQTGTGSGGTEELAGPNPQQNHRSQGHERRTEIARHHRAYSALIGVGLVNTRSVLIAIVCGLFSFALASLSLSLSRFGDGSLATTWLPVAVAAAFLLRLPLKNELLFLFGLFAGVYAADVAAGFSNFTSVIFGLANAIEAGLIVTLVRLLCGPNPAITKSSHLAFILFFGAILAPFASSVTALIAMTADLGLSGSALLDQAVNWHLAHGLGVILLTPALLLLADLWRERTLIKRIDVKEGTALVFLGLLSSYAIFSQPEYSLLFLIPPITLLHAFRLGALGTALFVAGLAILTAMMTAEGSGPVYEASISPAIRNHILQAFIAVNVITGLSVTAALASRNRMTATLEHGKQQLDILAENISDAVLHYNMDGVCTYASPSVRSVLGEVPSTFIGARFSDNMRKDAREQIEWAEQQLLSGASQNERFTYRRLNDSNDGTPVFIEAECAIVQNRSDDGTQDGIVVAARDVTERVELELLLTRARRQAEKATRAKSEFLANMSHEIRTPMNGVLGFAELLLQSDLNEDQKRQAHMIVESGRSMMMLLNDVLDLTRIEAGQIAIDYAPVDLIETISECAGLHQPNADKKNLTLKLDQSLAPLGGKKDGHSDNEQPQSQPWIMTDALRLRQIMLNLIGNAVKFTEKGSITISYHANDDEFTILVADTGIGIDQSRLGAIFLPFTQAEGDTARRFGGTGLGLSISHQLAELLGGRIEVDSETGKGSRFALVLPAIYAAPDSQPLPPPEPIAIGTLPHHARILLAEDHDVNRMLACEMLERCGQTVAVAHDGNEAISMVMDSVVRGSPYDLVLMDMQMPECDGYAATRTIRAEGITPEDLPIVALTANAFPEDIVAARKAGMQAHLAKPMVFADLARILQRWLPTRIVERDAETGAAPHLPIDEHDIGPDHAEVINLLHAARASHRDKISASGKAQSHSPALIKRWIARRAEAVEAVRSAFEDKVFDGETADTAKRESLAKLIHKLAGTAAMFGEPELGNQAASLENALRMNLDPKVQKALACDLLDLASRQTDMAAQPG